MFTHNSHLQHATTPDAADSEGNIRPFTSETACQDKTVTVTRAFIYLRRIGK